MSDARLYGDDPDHVSYYYGNYDALHGTIRLGDELIRDARSFEGWHPEFLGWAPHLWKDRAKGVPCLDPEKNAFHVRYLAEAMLDAGGWIGRYDEVSPDRHHAGVLLVNFGTRGVLSGSHRLRAWRYLITTRGIEYPVPLACCIKNSEARPKKVPIDQDVRI